MAVEKTFNGNTYNSDTSFAEYKYITALLMMAGDIMADAGRGLVTTSGSSYTLGSGTGTITMAAAIPFKAGAYIILADTAAPTTNYALVQASADASGPSLSFAEIAVVGTGTKTAWNLNISGPRGAQGLPGTNGTNGTNGADGFAPGGTAASALNMNGHKVTVDAVDGSYSDLGDVSTSATVLAVPYTRMNLTGDGTFGFTTPAASHFSGHILEVVNDDGGTGGREPTFTGMTFIGAPPNWGAQAAGTISLLGWMVTPTGLSRIWLIEEIAP